MLSRTRPLRLGKLLAVNVLKEKVNDKLAHHSISGRKSKTTYTLTVYPNIQFRATHSVIKASYVCEQKGGRDTRIKHWESHTCQSIGTLPDFSSMSLHFEKCLQPRNPRWADSGEGCAPCST